MSLLHDFCGAIREKWPEMKVLEEEPLKKHTSFQTGGPAWMVFPKTIAEMTGLYRLCLEHGISPLILGAGTNVLAPDRGLDRLVICTRDLSGIRDMADGKIEAMGGVTLTRLAVHARDLGLTGLEFAHGIPGTVGGGVYMNAGAYGGEIRQVAERTTALLPDGSLWEAEGEVQRFSYRHSAFQEKQAVILKTVFALQPGDPAEIQKTMQDLAARRRASQPLEYPSAGSTFKRPQGGYAAALIEQAGLKGKGVGRAAVSEKHAGFVINLGGATSKDVLATMDLIQKTVQEHSGICLEPEVRIW